MRSTPSPIRHGCLAPTHDRTTSAAAAPRESRRGRFDVSLRPAGEVRPTLQPHSGREYVATNFVALPQMPNGTPGDHPLTDILLHGRAVYSPAVDELVRAVARLSDIPAQEALGRLLITEYDPRRAPDLQALERTLVLLEAQRRRDAIERGWEV